MNTRTIVKPFASYAVILTLLFSLTITSCQEEENPNQLKDLNMDIEARLTKVAEINLGTSNARVAGGIQNWATAVNEAIAEYGIQLEKMEFIGAEEAGNTVFFSDKTCHATLFIYQFFCFGI